MPEEASPQRRSQLESSVLYVSALLGASFTSFGSAALLWDATFFGRALSRNGALAVALAGIGALVMAFLLARRQQRRVSDPAPSDLETILALRDVPIEGVGVTRQGAVRITRNAFTFETREASPRAIAIGIAALAGWYVLLSQFAPTWSGAAQIFSCLLLAVALPRLFESRWLRVHAEEIVAIERSGRVFRIHRDDAAPLAIAPLASKSDAVAAALATLAPHAMDAVPPPIHHKHTQPVPLWRTYVPEGRHPALAFGGWMCVVLAIAFGAANRLGLSTGFPIGAVLFTVAAVMIWLGDYARMTTVEMVEFEFGPSVSSVTAEIERSRRDLFALATPWRKSVISQDRDLLVFTHRSRDGFDALLMVGVACLGAACVFGYPHPLLALAYLLILLLSGLPRRTERRELVLSSHVRSAHFLGSRARLLIEDEDGAREMSLRFFAGNGARFKALVEQACPEAEIVEPLPGTGRP